MGWGAGLNKKGVWRREPAENQHSPLFASCACSVASRHKPLLPLLLLLEAFRPPCLPCHAGRHPPTVSQNKPFPKSLLSSISLQYFASGEKKKAMETILQQEQGNYSIQHSVMLPDNQKSSGFPTHRNVNIGETEMLMTLTWSSYIEYMH